MRSVRPSSRARGSEALTPVFDSPRSERTPPVARPAPPEAEPKSPPFFEAKDNPVPLAIGLFGIPLVLAILAGFFFL